MDSRQRGKSEKERAQRQQTFGKNQPQETENPVQASENLLVVSGPSKLEWINKLVFVQEFERAYAELLEICLADSGYTEAWFRLVEIAVRTGKDLHLLEQFKVLLGPVTFHDADVEGKSLRSENAATEMPRSILLAYFLLLIRMSERQQRDESEEQFINPTLNSQARQSQNKDVFALGQSDAEQSLSVSRSYLGLAGLEAGRRGYLLGKSLRVTRSPLVADDLALRELGDLEIEKFEAEKKGLGQNDASPGQSDKALKIFNQLNEILLEHKDDYAVWYVHGCVSELLGNLSQAIDSWTRAYQLNPFSLCVLSTLSELQQIGALPVSEETDYSAQFENLDRFAVHGTFETHFLLYEEFLQIREFRMAIAALRTLADWMQRQRGETPPEIEIVCLFGAMKAHRLEGNSGAAESCRREAENLTVSFKKSGENPEALAFVAARAEDFELHSLARMCYFSILTSIQCTKEMILKIAAHSVSRFSSRALAECLRVAYRNHKGDTEIRFCQLLCSLAIDNVPVKNYLERKNVIRQLLSQEEVGDSLSLLQEASAETSEDPEVHYYLAEIYSRLGNHDLALKHYEKMYQLDDLNAESVIRYMQFQLKTKAYAAAETTARKLLEADVLSVAQEGEVHWALAASSFARENIEDARHSIAHSLRCDPWNTNFLALALRLHNPLLSFSQASADEIGDTESLLLAFEDVVLADGGVFSAELKEKWIRKGKDFIRAGYLEFAYLMSCCVFKDSSEEADVAEFLCQAAGAFDSRLAASRLLMLLQQQKPNLSLPFLSTCIARIYAFTGEWFLVGEWIDIALKSGLDERNLRLQLFELEALKLLFEGNTSARAKALVEAVLDGYQNGQQSGQQNGQRAPQEIEILHGYLLVLQGNLKSGLEKMKQHIKTDATVLGLYFYLKGLDRAGQFPDSSSEELKTFLSKIPLNRLEQKLIEEIHMILGINQVDAIVRLPC